MWIIITVVDSLSSLQGTPNKDIGVTASTVL